MRKLTDEEIDDMWLWMRQRLADTLREDLEHNPDCYKPGDWVWEPTGYFEKERGDIDEMDTADRLAKRAAQEGVKFELVVDNEYWDRNERRGLDMSFGMEIKG